MCVCVWFGGGVADVCMCVWVPVFWDGVWEVYIYSSQCAVAGLPLQEARKLKEEMKLSQQEAAKRESQLAEPKQTQLTEAQKFLEAETRK